MSDQAIIPVDRIATTILQIRGRKVMLDSDLARLYGVSTKRLNEQVKRNLERFPQDFMFRLTREENAALRSQNATSNSGRGGRRYLPIRLHGTRGADGGDGAQQPAEVAGLSALAGSGGPSFETVLGVGGGSGGDSTAPGSAGVPPAPYRIGISSRGRSRARERSRANRRGPACHAPT